MYLVCFKLKWNICSCDDPKKKVPHPLPISVKVPEKCKQMNEDENYIRKLIEFLLGEHLAELLERIEGCDAVENCEFKFAKNFRGYVKKK